MTFPQTDYGFNPAEGYEGSLVESLLGFRAGPTARAEGAVRFGLPVIKGTAADDAIVPTAALTIPAADADAWITAAGTGVLGAGALVFQGSDFDGVQGVTPLHVSRKGVLVLNNHADWDVGSDIVFTYITDDGAQVTETFDVADLGNATFTTREFMRAPVRLAIGAGSGANRTLTVGTGAELGNLHILGMAARDRTIVQPATPVGYPIGTEIAPVTRGVMLVLVEDAVVKDMPAFCRLTIGGVEVQGAIRSNQDGTDAVPIWGVKFLTSGSAASLVPVEIQI